MEMKNFKIFLSLFAIISLFFMACEPMTDTKPDIGPAPTEDQLGISIAPGADAYHYILTNTSSAAGFAYWDLGNGKKASGNTVEVHYPDVDIYTITMTLQTRGGLASKSMQHEQTVPDPLAGNLVKGGKFLTTEDAAQWTILNINGAFWELLGGWAKIDNNPGSWNQAGIYQPIEVIAGQQYSVDFYFETAGAIGGWFKIYACTTEPTQTVEYTGPILVSEIGIWVDWNVSSGLVSGMFSDIHTSAGLNSNIVSFDTSGTIYLLIQCGANDLQDGVKVKNVEFRAYYP